LILSGVFYFVKMIVDEVHNDGVVYFEELDISQQEATH
jgi:hypothetical protein